MSFLDELLDHLDMILDDSDTAYRCDHCEEQVQKRVTDEGHTVTLSVYPSEDGEYTIDHRLRAVLSDGPHRYAVHHCRKEA